MCRKSQDSAAFGYVRSSTGPPGRTVNCGGQVLVALCRSHPSSPNGTCIHGHPHMNFCTRASALDATRTWLTRSVLRHSTTFRLLNLRKRQAEARPFKVIAIPCHVLRLHLPRKAPRLGAESGEQRPASQRSPHGPPRPARRSTRKPACTQAKRIHAGDSKAVSYEALLCKTQGASRSKQPLRSMLRRSHQPAATDGGGHAS